MAHRLQERSHATQAAARLARKLIMSTRCGDMGAGVVLEIRKSSISLSTTANSSGDESVDTSHVTFVTTCHH
jgi:hypothetical protein